MKNIDRISSLPDSIIHHILGFNDLKQAVQTSLLSRRWRFMWKSLPALSLDYLEMESWKAARTPDGFRKIVNQVLHQRENSISLEKFYLRFHYSDHEAETSIYKTWVLYAIEHSVEELGLYILEHGRHPFQPPETLFTCGCLTKLELGCLGGDQLLKVFLPNVISLPRLKGLILHRLELVGSSEDFVLDCPVLEGLIILSVDIRKQNLSILTPQLKYFKIDGQYESDGPASNGSVKLYAQNLLFLYIADFLLKDFVLEGLSGLVTANINMMIEPSDSYEGYMGRNRKEIYAKHMLKLLQDVQNVNTLTLTSSSLEVIAEEYALPERNLAQYSKLRNLGMDTSLHPREIRAMIYFLKFSPHVHTLSLRIYRDEYDTLDPYKEFINYIEGSEGEYSQSRSSSPYNHLKHVFIQGITGCSIELKFLEILLRKAVALEKMVVDSCTVEESLPLYTERCLRLTKFKEKLLALPTAASNIEITFSS